MPKEIQLSPGQPAIETRLGVAMYKVLDLFSGIGGFSLGLGRAGMQTVAFCEIDPYCQKVLKKYWPDVPIFGDIKQLNKDVLEDAGIQTVDLICGGPPCQPASIAGKRKGSTDDRWLWPEALRIVDALHPTWCLFENPTGILSLQGGIPFESALSHLEVQGYEVQAFIIPACAVGAPHRRDRVWIVAHSTGMECQSRAEKQRVLRAVPDDGTKRDNLSRPSETQSWEDVANTKSSRWDCAPQQKLDEETRDGKKRYRLNNSSQDVVDSMCNGLPWAEHEKPRKGTPGGKRRFTNKSNEGVTDKRRQTQSGLGGVFNGFPFGMDKYRWPAPCGCEQYEWEPPRVITGKIPYRKERLQALGNAVVPQVVEILGRAILTVELTNNER